VRGKPIPLSPARKFIGDVLHFSKGVPTVPVQRRMRLDRLVAARATLAVRPSWTSIFTKAYAQVAAGMPELRRAYVKFPWPHLYEYTQSAASVAVERDHAGEKAVFFGRIKQPDCMPLIALDQSIDHLREVPVEQHDEFQKVLTVSRLPRPLRRVLWWLCLNISRVRGHHFGTFAVSVYSGLGAESLHPLSPLATTLNYGVIGSDGNVDVRITYDHRVMDGATVARALQSLESTLMGEILDELCATANSTPKAA
jgi:hypothetical protein